MNFEQLKKKIEVFTKEREWDQFHSVKNLSMALSVESSELVEIYQWKTEEESNKTSQKPDLQQSAAEEIADIFIYLVQISNKTGVDLEAAVLNKISKNALKYPVDKSEGSSKKYTKF